MDHLAATIDDTPPVFPFAETSVTPESHGLTFSGSGGEYFRIWIVNLLLTIATLGIYSAWAKVRRQQYFDRNTHLAGAVFDFTGNPMAILRGRILAVILLAAYQYAFGFSLAVGLAVVLVLLACLPYLLRGALRFRLHNTRYRGMRFNFTGSTAGAYRAYLPPMLGFMLPTVLVAVTKDPKMLLTIFALYLLWPWMHGVIKAYQHKHFAFGNLESRYDVRPARFYVPYLLTLGIGLIAVLLTFGIAIVINMLTSSTVSGKSFNIGFEASRAVPIFFGLLCAYLMYLLAGCYLHVRLTNMVWTNTSFPGIWIKPELKWWAFLRLQAINVILTVLTLGLYRPFAVVKVYEYHLSNIQVQSFDSFDHIMAGSTATSDGGADGVADLFGIDLAL
jgi:uncharacterized membrane protein YjgN (DUF898 family)